MSESYNSKNLLHEKERLIQSGNRKVFYIDRMKKEALFFAPFPASLEIGIMGKCDIGQSGVCLSSGIQCSQNGLRLHEPNMSSFYYKKIIDEVKGRIFQVVLSGRGDPDIHADFPWILKYTRENGIIPNFITSGFHLNEETVQLSKVYCGSVNVSFHNQFYTYNAIKMLVNLGVRTNIFFVISKSSIDDAIRRLENNAFPEGINAVVFLLHKPVGLGSRYNVLGVNDEKVRRFFQLISWNHAPYRIAMDACSIPGILNFVHNSVFTNLQACEGGRWSAYISPGLKMMPCSFCIDHNSWSHDIKEDTIENAWRSKPFSRFRSILAERCPECCDRIDCRGGCPIMPEIVLCDREEREYGLN